MHDVNPALLTVAAAAVFGLIAQLVGQRWKIPALVPLLVVGMTLGPSGLGLLQPASLGSGLSVLVKLCVAVILFDGALNLRIGDLRLALGGVRNLVTVGALVTWIGAALTAWLIAGFSGPVAIVFGALLTVTGPTVVQPILRRVSLPRRLKTVLEGEAILIDPIGAVLAVAVVDVVLGMAGVRPIGLFGGLWGYVARLVVGAAAGVGGAVVLSWLLRRRSLVPADLANLVSLAGVWGVFALAEWMQGESGIMAVVALGLAMQRGSVPEERRLRQFKEQLTVLGISLLFILLSANLPLDALRQEGMRGVLTVVVLMWVVRPISVWVALRRSDFTWRERAFVSWIAPRGIVAASVASLFAIELGEAGFAEGQRVLAITFMTIAITVTVQGLTVGPVARLLGLESLAGRGIIIIGAGPLAIELAKALRQFGRPVSIVDRNGEFVALARGLGFDAITGNALDDSVLEAAGADEAETVVAVTSNPEVNALASHLAHDAFGVARAYPALASPGRGASPRLLDRVGGHPAFGRPLDVRAWDYDLEHGAARSLTFLVPEDATEAQRTASLPDAIVPLARARQQSVEVCTEDQTWRPGDQVVVVTTLTDGEATAVLDDICRADRQKSAAPTV